MRFEVKERVCKSYSRNIKQNFFESNLERGLFWCIIIWEEKLYSNEKKLFVLVKFQLMRKLSSTTV